MKLILSSRDFLNDNSRKVIMDNLPKRIEECKVLFIPNEKANDENLRSDKYYNRLFKDGFTNKNNIYIFDEKKANDFKNLELDLIYIGGGNTFATMKKIKNSNFDKEIIKYVRNGVTYIGGSCGAHIVTKNIEHAKYFDTVCDDFDDFTGLGLFDGIIIPHFNEERKEFYDLLKHKSKWKVYPLTDSDSIVAIDDSVKVIYG